MDSWIKDRFTDQPITIGAGDSRDHHEAGEKRHYNFQPDDVLPQSIFENNRQHYRDGGMNNHHQDGGEKRHYKSNDDSHQVGECINPSLIANNQAIPQNLISTDFEHDQKESWDHGTLVCSNEDTFHAKIDTTYLMPETLNVIYDRQDLIIEGTMKDYPPKPFRRYYRLPKAIWPEDITWKLEHGFLDIMAKAGSKFESGMDEQRAMRHVSDAFSGGFKASHQINTH